MSFLWENHKNENSGEFLNFTTITLYMIFQVFHENSHDGNDQFQKIRDFDPNFIIMIFPKNSEFWLKTYF